MINNIAYACALNDDIDKAEKYLTQIKNSEMDDSTEICLLATKGLIDFRKGLYNTGRELYLSAIKKSQEYKYSPILKYTAFLNYAREELRVNPEAKNHIGPEVSDIKDSDIDEHTRVLKNDVMMLIEKINIESRQVILF